LSWWEAYVTTEAYARMGRMDLSRHTLERGIAALPKPISPVLSGEIRLATVFLQWLEHHRLDTDALQEARRQFRTMGAGRRLGHVLMWEGEAAWSKANWEEARQLYAQALTLFKQYRDGFRLHEAQLKLGLILKEKPLATLYPPVQ
jgi:tetratricopeptide (TPR) repeat protein